MGFWTRVRLPSDPSYSKRLSTVHIRSIAVFKNKSGIVPDIAGYDDELVYPNVYPPYSKKKTFSRRLKRAVCNDKVILGKDAVKLETLKDEYRTIIERLDALVQEGSLSDFDRTTLLETADDVIREIAKKYQNVVKEMRGVMGGTLLETNARRIKNEAQRLAEIGNDLVEKAFKMQKS